MERDSNSLPACAVCQSSNRLRQRRALADGHVFECANCGLAFFGPVPCVHSPSASEHSVQTDEGYTRQMLDNAASATARNREREVAQRRHSVYCRYLGRSRYRLLEIGCGAAVLGPHFADLGVEYHGIDIDHRCVEAAQRHRSILVEQRDFLDLEDNQNVDVICFSQVLEHIVDPLRFVRRVHSQLAPDGLVHCDVPNHDRLGSVLSRLQIIRDRSRWGGIQYPFHLFAYRKRTLQRLFSEWFDAEVFGANTSHPCWGNPLIPSSSTACAAYGVVCTMLHMQQHLITIGRKREPLDRAKRLVA